MEKYLLEHIRNLENKLLEIQEKEDKLKKVVNNLRKISTPILEVSTVNKEIKEKILKFYNTLNSNLGIESTKMVYTKDGYLSKEVFFEIIKNMNLEKNIFFIFKLRDSSSIDVASSFIESKFTPFLSIDVNKIIGVIPKDKLKEFEETKFIPCFRNNKYEELHFFVIFFELPEFNEVEYQKAINLYDRFSLKPSMNDKSFVHYSLVDNKIIDFDLIEKENIKKEYAYINELKYPELENMIRKEIRNTKFVLALLDRIDNELVEIKKSKGTIIVVRRILNFIHRYQLDPEIQEMTKLISQELEKEETIIPK